MIHEDDLTQTLTMSCDTCEDELDVHYDREEFLTMVDKAKSEGWRIRPSDNGGWTHQCKSCAAESRIERQRRLLGNG